MTSNAEEQDVADEKKTKQPERSKAQIERDIAAARARLSSNIEGLITEAHPKTIVNRQVDDAKAFVVGEVNNAKDSAKAQVIDAKGEPRWDRIAVIGGAVAGALTFILTIRALVTRSKRKKAANLDVDELIRQLRNRHNNDLEDLLKKLGR